MVNTALLTAASLLMRVIGMSFGVYIAGKVGAQGIGLFELIMSVYTLGVSFAASGVKLSSTRLVVDAMSRRIYTPKSVMRLCMGYGMILGLLSACAMYYFAPAIASKLLNHPEVAISLKILAFSLPFISLSNSLSGYFTAVRKSAHFAGVQVIEQFMRIGLTLWLLSIILPMGGKYAPIALVSGSCIAEALSLFLSYTLYRLDKSGRATTTPFALIGGLLKIALPDAAGSWIRSFLHTAKQLLIPRGLGKSGLNSDLALASYGVINGMVLPVITFPSALLTALSGLLIPELAECRGLGQTNRIRYMTERVINITITFSAIAAVLIFLLADEIGNWLYPNTNAIFYMRLLAPVIPIMYTDMTIDGILKGLGLQVASMRYNIVDATMSLLLVWFLVPRLAIWGYIVTIYASEILNFYLSISKLVAVTEFRLRMLHREDFLWLLSIFK